MRARNGSQGKQASLSRRLESSARHQLAHEAALSPTQKQTLLWSTDGYSSSKDGGTVSTRHPNYIRQQQRCRDMCLLSDGAAGRFRRSTDPLLRPPINACRAVLAGGVVLFSKAGAFLKAGGGALKAGAGLLGGGAAVAVATTAGGKEADAAGQQQGQQPQQLQQPQQQAYARLPSLAPPPK